MRWYPGGGAFVLFFHPHPREFATQNKKSANARGLAQGGGGGMGAAGIDWHIIHRYNVFRQAILCCKKQNQLFKDYNLLLHSWLGPKGVAEIKPTAGYARSEDEANFTLWLASHVPGGRKTPM